MKHIGKKYWLPICFILVSGFAGQVAAQNKALRKLITEKNWNELFPHRYGYRDMKGKKKNPVADLFSYKAFLAAADSFPQFLSGQNKTLQKRELCALLANMAYETGGGWEDAPGGYYKWGFYFAEERNCENGCPFYSDTSKKNYPPVNGRSYHGRGPLQLSWNYNYGQFSERFLRDKAILLKNPSLVTTDPVLCFASALWFWTTSQFPKPACHDILYAKWIPNAKDSAAGRLPGFGTVVNVINGGLECGGQTTEGSKYRYGYYLYLCTYFAVDPGQEIYCRSQKPFGQ